MASSFLNKISKFFGLDSESEFDDFESDIDEYENDMRKKQSQKAKSPIKLQPSYYRTQRKEKLTRSSIYGTKKKEARFSLKNHNSNNAIPKIQNNGYAKVGLRHTGSSSKQKDSISHLKGSNVVSMQQAAQKVQSNASSYRVQSRINSEQKMRSKIKEEEGFFKIAIKEPRVYSQVLDVANLLLAKEAVLVNFHLMEEVAASRVIDFLTGAVFALDGDIQRIDNEIFLLTPSNMEISGDIARSLLNQANVN
ncbi:MAG: cell division protein SepF [Streptococcaceae bacterium]|jgi:cell division inhibitor SepF|nr:cell division protein SepF [Streptococcaceae bacterium]